MKRLLLALLLAGPLCALGQPLIKNAVTTNALANAAGVLTNNGFGVLSFVPSGGGGGSETPIAFNTLTYSTTNVTLDCSLGTTNAAAYSLSLTGAAWFTTPTGVPTTAKGFQIWFRQPSTGLVTVGWTNVSFKFPGAVQPIIDTNNNAVTVVTFGTSPFTNSTLNFFGTTPQIQ